MKAVDAYVAAMLVNLDDEDFSKDVMACIAESAQYMAEAVCRVSGHDYSGQGVVCQRCGCEST